MADGRWPMVIRSRRCYRRDGSPASSGTMTPSREMRSTGLSRPARALLGAAIAVMAAAVWFLPHRAPRPAPALAAPSTPRTNAPSLAESTADVTLSEYTKLCSVDDVTSCERACDRGDAASCRSLGWHVHHGTGRLKKDEARAAALYSRAGDGGDAQGCANLGVMYAYGQGVAKDDAKAAAAYQRACDQGNAQACTNLGVMYDHGRGVEHDEVRA